MRHPFWLVRLYYRMLSRLTAEESLLAAQQVQLGSGVMKQADARSLRQRWVKAAAPARPKAQKVDFGALGAMGIGFRVVGPDGR